MSDQKPMPEKERVALNKMYKQALTYVTERDWVGPEQQAWGLARDALEYYMQDSWYTLNCLYPVAIISNRFINFLKALPAKDKDTREWEAYRGQRFRYNWKKRNWENSREPLRISADTAGSAA